jgi:glutathione synthase/RimK-type ligase-like ATP-grasp enzyme
LSSDAHLKKHAPYTTSYSEKALFKLIYKYHTIILKPNRGSSGNGMMKVSKREAEAGYLIQSKRKLTQIESNKALVQHIKKKMKKRTYLIQEYIERMKWKQQPSDIRAIDQNGKVYVIELTNKPSLRKLQYDGLDPSMYSGVKRLLKL